MPKDFYKAKASQYASMGIAGTAYLAYRDLPSLLKKHGFFEKKNLNILDFGCGSGRSLSFLKTYFQSEEHDLSGADISEAMINEAKKTHHDCQFFQIKPLKNLDDKWPVQDNAFDLVFSTLVLFEIPSLEEMSRVLKEIYRILKPKGSFIFSTGTEHLYKMEKQWISIAIDFEQCPPPYQAGSPIDLLIREANVIVRDYYYTRKDYEKSIREAHFKIKAILLSGGNEGDQIEWLDEKTPNEEPFVSFLLGK